MAPLPQQMRVLAGKTKAEEALRRVLEAHTEAAVGLMKIEGAPRSLKAVMSYSLLLTLEKETQ